jgi:hypothetical protein
METVQHTLSIDDDMEAAILMTVSASERKL